MKAVIYNKDTGIGITEDVINGVTWRVISQQVDDERKLVAVQINPTQPVSEVMSNFLDYLDPIAVGESLHNRGKAILIQHLVDIHKAMFPTYSWDDNQVRITARIYNDLHKWGDSAPNATIAKMLDRSNMTIRNRTAVARSKGWLPPAQSKGSRKYRNNKEQTNA